jgi:hypothetical protein
MAECDKEIEHHLGRLDNRLEADQKPLSSLKNRHKPSRNEPRFDLRIHLYRILGVDFTEVPGVNVLTAHTFLTEVGLNLCKFTNDAALASWLGVCPDNRISGSHPFGQDSQGDQSPMLALRMSGSRSIVVNLIWVSISAVCAVDLRLHGVIQRVPQTYHYRLTEVDLQATLLSPYHSPA